MSLASHLDELRASARYHRRRLQLYRAKIYAVRPFSRERLGELERRSALADETLRRAEADFSQPEDPRRTGGS